MPKTDVNQALKCENGGPTGGRGWLVARLGVGGGVVNAKKEDPVGGGKI